MNKNKKSQDFELAYNLQRQINRFGLTENATLTEKEKDKDYIPRTLIDQTLELIDPTPNVHTLFVQFNERFFWNVLLPVEIKWSQRMTSCAGTCTFHPRNRQCVIALSVPLLKLRPRKDLVETLLHEMIHGYLFLTNNNRDRDGHGPEFCKHMNRINGIAGTKISIYHSFHEEVRLHQQHWWKCDGPCHKEPPYFGMVRRATNRAPGPNDFWWQKHQERCGGNYIKIKEPENFKSRNSKKQSKNDPVSKPSSKSSIANWLVKPTSSTATTSKAIPISTTSKPNLTTPINGFKKLGNDTNKVHGWGTGGPTGSSSSRDSQKSNNISSSTPKFTTSGTLGGSKSGISNLLTKFGDVTNNKIPKLKGQKTPEKTVDSWINHKKVTPPITKNKEIHSSSVKLVECPICTNFVCSSTINEHVDKCLAKDEDKLLKPSLEKKIQGNVVPQKRKNDEVTPIRKQPKLDFSDQLKTQLCPICNKQCSGDINIHIDKCLNSESLDFSTPIKSNNSKNSASMNNSIIYISDSSDIELTPLKENRKPPFIRSDPRESKTAKTGHKCLVCDKFISADMSLNDHLEDCIGSVFSDDSTLSSPPDCKLDNNRKGTPLEIDKFPCPVCMEIVPQSLMNKHLDGCLLLD